MKIEDIEATVAKLSRDIDALNKERDKLGGKVKDLSAERARLEYALKIANDAPPGARTHVLSALGIESTEKVNKK